MDRARERISSAELLLNQPRTQRKLMASMGPRNQGSNLLFCQKRYFLLRSVGVESVVLPFDVLEYRIKDSFDDCLVEAFVPFLNISFY